MDKEGIRGIVDEIAALASGSDRMNLMEVCGTHTVSLFRTGAKSLLPETVRLVSGPGCPVCVTSQAYIDLAGELALRPDTTVCTYGDMVRVPGRRGSLEALRAEGAKVAVVYSARDALAYARRNPERHAVFLAVGFETTTPATAATVLEAENEGLKNFYILGGHKRIIPAMHTLLSAGEVPIDGFLCPGHVSVVIGAGAYEPIASHYRKPCVVAGFELEGMLRAILLLVRQAVRYEARVENTYGAAVTVEGNRAARELTERVFEPSDAVWRAMGRIPESGLDLRPAYRRYDAMDRFGLSFGSEVTPHGCLCGEVIQGKALPTECALFRKKCTPREPVGPCMVSMEGTCAAWYKYGPARAEGGGNR
ncbi:MAG: hydrogenase formation protein HypD [Candidatus Eisenbacteria bacterium]|nr:hydrogenase formation protein HypD [Candidatus Eisenbacteria bacterium]